jgi:hypothetical protein
VLLTASAAFERDAQLCCESTAQAAARPMQSRLHRASRHPDERGDLPYPQVIDVVELDGLPLFGRFPDGPPHEVVELTGFLSRVRGWFHVHPDEAADRPSAAPILDWYLAAHPQPGLREVHHDPEQPGDEPVAVAQLCEIEKRMEQRLLHHVLRIGARTENAHGQARRAVAMPVDQDAKGIPVTGEHPLHDRAVVAHERRHIIVVSGGRMVAA